MNQNAQISEKPGYMRKVLSRSIKSHVNTTLRLECGYGKHVASRNVSQLLVWTWCTECERNRK